MVCVDFITLLWYSFAVMAVETLVIRQAIPDDIAAITDLVVSRRVDSNPDQAEYEAAQAAKFATYGQKIIGKTIEQSISHPLEAFAHVALIDTVIVGSAFASAAPTEQYTVWRGLTTHPDYDGRGIGGALEESRQAWARKVGRPVRARIPESNQRSYRFFTERGFRDIAIIPPTPKVPMAFREVGLDWD